MFLANNLNKGGSLGGYQISRSLRFNSADSAYLNRTPASASNRKTWTWSGWVKKTVVGDGRYPALFGAVNSTRDVLRFNGESLNLFFNNTSSANLVTTAVYRDVSAWYHVVLAVDTTQATDTNRVKLYVNGIQITSFSTASYPAQNYDTFVNMNVVQRIGNDSNLSDGYYNGYMTEIYMVDGQALTPSSFGYTNPSTGVWSPLAFVGTYGTNGFYLNFSDNSNTTAATLGKDYSGNGNNWTPNNFSVTAGAGNDSLVDSPTSYGTDTGVGGTVRGNYCTWNAVLQTLGGTASTYTNGNLVASSTSSNWVLGTIRINDAKYYFELVPDSAASGLYLGLNSTTDVRVAAYSGGIEASPGGGSNQGSLASWSNGDVIGVAVDGPNKTVQFYRNGSTYGTLVTYTTALDLWAFARNGGVGSSQVTANFGQRPFAYTAPSGYKALCTQNLPTPTIGATSTTLATNYFTPVTYTGTGAARSVTVGFQPDFVWIKDRTSAEWHRLYDSVRGATKELFSNTTNAEGTDVNGLTAFDSNGFSVGTLNAVNKSADALVAWNWKANGSGSTNTAGSITSIVSANTTSGFSVVTYTGAGGTATVGHGLGVAPSMVVVKRRNAVSDWFVYHTSIGATKGLFLNNTYDAVTSANLWNNTAPTSTVFSIGSDATVNTGTYVAYCFSEVQGFSKFGSYVGNGSADGPFVFCGFRPAFIMIKATSGTSTGNWVMQDDMRSPSNVSNKTLYANLSNAEDTSYSIDFLSNGFKLRSALYDATNQSGANYVYMAFAEAPTKFSLAR